MKKKMLPFLLIATLILTCSFTGCGGGDKPAATGGGKTLIIQDTEPWEGVDLFQVAAWYDIQLLIADPILERDPVTFEATPGIASKSVWSEDGLTWTLTFPEGMKYSTGEQLEPEDFIASVEYGLEVSEYAEGYQNIDYMEVDGRDVIVHLKEFQGDMEFNFESCFVGIMDKDELDTMSADEKLWGIHPYGAYYVEDYQPGAYAMLKANPGYVTHNPMLENKGAAPIENIKVVFSGESFTLAQGVKNGDYDVLAAVPSEYYEELAKEDNIEMVEAYVAEIVYAEFNMKDPLFQDKNVRKAVIHAISRENMDAYLGVFQTPAYSFILPKSLNYSEEAETYFKENYGYDAELSKKLLKEAGWVDTNNDGIVDKDGKKFTFTYNCRDAEPAKQTAQSMQVDLKAVGIEMLITTQNWAYVVQDVTDGNFQLANMCLGWSEPFLLLDLFCQRNVECTNPDPEGLKTAIADARKTLDYNERTEKVTAIQKTLLDYCTIMPLVSNNGYRCWRSEIQGIKHTPMGGFYLGDVMVDAEGNFRNVE